MTAQHPFISTRGLREPLEEEVEPTPQEKYDHAMNLVREYGYASGECARGFTTGRSDRFMDAFGALSYLFADIYKLDEQ